MTDDTKYKQLTRAQSKLIDASVAIFGEPATKKDATYSRANSCKPPCRTRTPATFLYGSVRTAT
jgi:hypothetical protein